MLYAFPRDYFMLKYILLFEYAYCIVYRYKTVVIINKRESNQINSRLMDFYHDHYL